MGIDLDLVRQRLIYITHSLRFLQKVADADPGDFARDEVRVAAAESHLRRALEAVFDIGRHFLAKSGHTDLAAEYRSIARGLADIGVVSPSLGESLVELARYRNRLVHLYDQVTEQELYATISTRLGELRAFVRAVRDHCGLARNSGEAEDE